MNVRSAQRCLLTLLALVLWPMGQPTAAQRTRLRRCTPCVATLHLTQEAAAALSSSNSNNEADRLLAFKRVPRKYDVRGAQFGPVDPRPDPTFLIHVLYEDSYDEQGWDRLQLTVNHELVQVWSLCFSLRSGHVVRISLLHTVHGRCCLIKSTCTEMLHPQPQVPDAVKAHAAGYGEAFFTASDIWAYWANYKCGTRVKWTAAATHTVVVT
jgi:hypothetical protein